MQQNMGEICNKGFVSGLELNGDFFDGMECNRTAFFDGMECKRTWWIAEEWSRMLWNGVECRVVLCRRSFLHGLEMNGAFFDVVECNRMWWNFA
ncbi:A Disintegrin And Metalloproteinase With Thrombospondin Motifs 3 [Manis pentadactyla]|nr:A Disintegrin And Metalloproteinase With Thrombospondin Motifs 3 [Manis pentadactyla]